MSPTCDYVKSSEVVHMVRVQFIYYIMDALSYLLLGLYNNIIFTFLLVSFTFIGSKFNQAKTTTTTSK